MARRKVKLQVDLKQAEELYHGEMLSLTDTSRRMGVSPEILRIRMIENGLKLRTRLEGFNLRFKGQKDAAKREVVSVEC